MIKLFGGILRSQKRIILRHIDPVLGVRNTNRVFQRQSPQKKRSPSHSGFDIRLVRNHVINKAASAKLLDPTLSVQQLNGGEKQETFLKRIKKTREWRHFTVRFLVREKTSEPLHTLLVIQRCEWSTTQMSGPGDEGGLSRLKSCVASHIVRNGVIGVEIGVARESGDVTSAGVDDSDELELRPGRKRSLFTSAVVCKVGKISHR